MAEVTAFRNNALPYPVYGVPWTIVFALLDADGDPVTGATCDSEVSINGDTGADCTNEGTEITFTTATNKGQYYLTLTAAEMTGDIITVSIYSATSKATVVVLYPRKLVTLTSGTSQGGAAGYITLAASTVLFNNQYNGCLCVATIDTLVEARILQVCTQSNQQCTVTPSWNVVPDADDTYIIYLPEGRQIPEANIRAISDDTTAADNLETACDNYSATRGLAGTALPAVAADGAGGLPISDAGGLDLDAIKTMTDKIGTIVNTGGTATIGAILGDAANSALVTRIADIKTQTGTAGAGLTAIPWNAAWDAEVQSECDDAITASGIKGATFDTSTDSLEAIRDRGDAAWITGAGGDPWATALPGAYGAGTAGKIIGDNINAPVGTVDTVVDNIYAAVVTNAAGTDIAADIIAVKTQLDVIQADTDLLDDVSGGLADIHTDVGTAITNIGTVLTDTNAIHVHVDKIPLSDGVLTWNSTALAGVQTECEDAITASGIKGATFDTSTDSLEAIRNRGDAAWASGGTPPTAAAIADAVWDEAVADHTTGTTFGGKNQDVMRGTDNAALASVCTETRLAELDAANIPTDLSTIDTVVDAIKLKTDTLGGAGALTWTYTLTNSSTGAAIIGADVWVTTDIAGTNIVATGTTGSSGNVTFYLDAGTYYIWRQCNGYTFTNPDTEIVP